MDPLAGLLGESGELRAVRDRVHRLLARPQDARRVPPMLIQGETGTGKGLLARLLHRAGPRASGPFVDVNCAAIPETLLEAEMFGFERGAFTDARRSKAGLFQTAHRGTIFLDEVGLLSDGLQTKLLNAIEDRSVRRLGATQSETVDVWIMAATNEDLRVAVRDRRFREDLYHRLAVLTVALPPLRARGRDILLLAEHFLVRACADYSVPAKSLGSEAEAALLRYDWPGNVRELHNVIERAVLLAEEPVISAEMLGLPEAPVDEAGPSRRAEPGGSLDDAVRSHLLDVLKQTHWNISRAAEVLGISRNTVRARIEKYGLRPADGRPALRRSTSAPPAPVPDAGAERPEAAARPAVGRERRRVTLLMATIAQPPTGPIETSRALQLLVDKARSFGGRVEDLGETEVIAAFGLEPVEDAPRRAANAAMAMRKGLQRAQPDRSELPAGLRVGIHVAPLTVGRSHAAVEIEADESRREALAGLRRLTEEGEPGAVVVSASAVPFLERRFELVAVGPAPADRYRLSGLERSGLALGERMGRFVGRSQELELLRGLFDSAGRGAGQAVGIAGEAGIGKSRLVYEFRQSLAGRAVVYLEGRCLSFGAAIPYLPLLDIVRASCDIADADTADVITGKVRRGLEAVGMDAVVGAPYLLHLLGLKPGTGRLSALDPEAIKVRTFDTLRHMSLKLSQRAPLVIFLEDLHWVDRASEEYFASLADVVPGARIFLVAAYRSGYRPPWIERSYATQVALQPLAPEHSADMLRSVTGSDQLVDALARLILSKAEGNPFFLEELVRVVKEQGGMSPTLVVPDTVEEVLLARIDRLPCEDKRLLEATAVIGKDAPFSLIRAAVDQPDDAVRAGLLRLQAAEFLYGTGLVPEPEYSFKHALTHEVAYNSLEPNRRSALHARIAALVEQLAGDRLDEQVERLAHHAFRGEAWRKALRYLRQAGRRAAARSAHGEAVACFERALVALGHLPQEPDVLQEAIDLRFDLKTSLTPAGAHARMFEHLQQADALARALDDQPRLGRIAAYASDYFRLIGDHARAIESGERALAIANAVGDFGLRVAANTYLGLVYYTRGDYRQAKVYLGRNVTWLIGDRARERFDMAQLPAVHSRTWFVCSLAELGEFAEGRAEAKEALRIAGSVDHPLSLTAAHYGFGQVCLRQGEVGAAIPPLERSLDLCRNWDLGLWFPPVAAALGLAYVRAERISAGLSILEQAVEREASMHRIGSHSARLLALGEGYFCAGHLPDAGALARRAHDLSEARSERGYMAWALRLLGDVAAGDPAGDDEVGRLYAAACALAEDLGMRPLLAHVHHGLGAWSSRRGDVAAAQRHLATAAQMARAMAMSSWADQVEAELKQLG